MGTSTSQAIIPLSPVDSGFFKMESHETPMHVATLLIFEIPVGSSQCYVGDVVKKLRDLENLQTPWCYKIRIPKLASIKAEWIVDTQVDLDYHIRHQTLPYPGGEKELGVLVSRLHSQRLNMRRPLWECHVIESLSENRFAIYTKMHHALVDGVTAVRLMTQILTAYAAAELTPPWFMPSKAESPSQSLDEMPLEAGSQGLKNQLALFKELAQAVGRFMEKDDEVLSCIQN